MSWWAITAILAGLLVANVLYLLWYFGWVDRQTSGAAYFSRSIPERRALKRRIRLLSLPLRRGPAPEAESCYLRLGAETPTGSS